MPLFVPPYAKGRDIVKCSVLGLTADSTGALAEGNFSVDLHSYGVMDAYKVESDRGLEEFTPLDGLIKAFLPTAADFTLTLGEILRTDTPPQLDYINSSFDYVVVYLGIAGTYNSPAWQSNVLGAVASGGFEINPGKSTCSLMVKPVGYWAYVNYNGTVSGHTGAAGAPTLSPNFRTNVH